MADILVGCEYSGVVRDALLVCGHNAYSCDLEDTDSPGPHLKMDIFRAIRLRRWDVLIAFPDCTFLCNSGRRWCMTDNTRFMKQERAIRFVKRLWNSPIEHIGLENPVGILSTEWLEPTQIIQPHYFGEPKFKETCFWLKNLPILQRTHWLKLPRKGTVVWREWNEVHHAQPGSKRGKKRARFYPPVATAMAEQWTAFLKGYKII